MIILASKSPRRKQLLMESGFEFMVKHFDVDESYPKTLKKQDIPLFLSRKKAENYNEPLDDVVLINVSDSRMYTFYHPSGSALNR